MNCLTCLRMGSKSDRPGAVNLEELRAAFSPFSEDEIWILERFVRKVDELRESAFAQSETKLRGTTIPGATYLGGPAIQMAVDGPTEEMVKAVAGDFRQLYTDTNNTSAMRVMKILQGSAYRQRSKASEEVIEAIRGLRRRMQQRKQHDPRGVFLEETDLGESRERTPAEIISIWLNGEYFHDDQELADELDPAGHMSTEMMRMSLQMAIRDFIAYWTQLRNLIVRLLALEG